MNILSSSNGKATVLGTDSCKLGPKDFEQIGYVSENQEMPEWMTVGQFLDYCKKMYPNWDDKFCADLIGQFDLSLKQKIKSLSRGMKMKASLISSLVYRPKILIFDEPFSGLDPLVRDEFISGVLDITENEKWTIFVSSHDIDEVERLADWVGIIDKGTLKIVEETEKLQSRFRKIEITLGESSDLKTELPVEWLLFKQQDRTIHFFDSNYEKNVSENKFREMFPNCSNIDVSEMSLKEIFIVYAKQYKISVGK